MKTHWKSSLDPTQLEQLEQLRVSDPDSYRKARQTYYMRWWVRVNPEKVEKTNQKILLKRKNDPVAKEKVIARVGRWKKQNRDKVLASYHNNKHKHKSKIKAKSREYYLNNKEVLIRKHVEYAKQRRIRDVAYRVETCLRSRFRSLLIGRRREFRTMETLGCTREEFKLYLESLWLPGMSWDNYGLHGWHIDHKRPCCTFNLLDESQVKQCFHYTNMQPLWAADNLHKQRRYFPVEPLVSPAT